MKAKILAIDFGTKTIGLAISDNDNKFAIPYCEIKNDNKMFDEILEIISFENIKTIIIGFPKTENNYVSQRHALIEEFKQKLHDKINDDIKVFFVDESYSTQNAFNSLKEFNIKTSRLKKNKDMIAASIILENYLKYKKNYE